MKNICSTAGRHISAAHAKEELIMEDLMNDINSPVRTQSSTPAAKSVSTYDTAWDDIPVPEPVRATESYSSYSSYSAGSDSVVLEAVKGLLGAMVGAIPGGCYYTGHPVRFGYVTLRDKNHRMLPDGSDEIRGHEFHYFDSETNGSDACCFKPAGKGSFPAAHIKAGSWCGFAHLFYPSNPEFAPAFVRACAGRVGVKKLSVE